MIKEITKCRICGNSNLIKVLDLGEQVLTGVFPKKKQEKVTRGPLQLVLCHKKQDEDVCGLLQLAHSYDLDEMYGLNYGYRSGLNQAMVSHLRKKVNHILTKIDLSPDDLVIDIGSNDSTTLQAYPKQGLKLVGVDPTGVKFKDYYPEHIALIPEFFSLKAIQRNLGAQKAKVITSFSMFYDLEDPMSFMMNISDVLHQDGVWVFEQSYMPTMLERNSYDTVCHEHIEYYGLKQIKWMTDKAGLRVIDVEFNDINGGSFSVTVAKSNSKFESYAKLNELLEYEDTLQLSTLNPYKRFKERIEILRNDLLNFLKDAKENGARVFALGASTKGNVILQYCGITPDQIECIGEVNQDKFGSFTPGTLLPIISENELPMRDNDYFLVLPWHFSNFFKGLKKFSGKKLVFPLPNLEIFPVD